MTATSLPIISFAEHKARLLQEGEAYRLGLLNARATVGEAMYITSLLQRAVFNWAGLLVRRPEGTGLALGGRMLLPLLFSSGRFLLRKRLLLPVLGMGVLVGMVAWMAQRKLH